MNYENSLLGLANQQTLANLQGQQAMLGAQGALGMGIGVALEQRYCAVYTPPPVTINQQMENDLADYLKDWDK